MKISKLAFILLGTFFVCASPLISKNPENRGKYPRKIQFIAKGGINLSLISSLSSNDTFGAEKSRIGYNMGAMVDISLSNHFHLQPSLNLLAKRSKLKDIEIGLPYKIEMSMNSTYIQLPLLVAYKFSPNRWNNTFNIALGPYFAYGIGGDTSSKDLFEFGTFSSDGLCEKFDTGINMELQYELPKIMFTFGYQYGFTNALKNKSSTGSQNGKPSLHNSINYLTIGYKF